MNAPSALMECGRSSYRHLMMALLTAFGDTSENFTVLGPELTCSFSYELECWSDW
jgi:hypothetical protein